MMSRSVSRLLSSKGSQIPLRRFCLQSLKYSTYRSNTSPVNVGNTICPINCFPVRKMFRRDTFDKGYILSCHFVRLRSSSSKPDMTRVTGDSKTDELKQNVKRSPKVSINTNGMAKKGTAEARSAITEERERPQLPVRKESSKPTIKRAKKRNAPKKSTVMDEYGYTFEEPEEETFPITAYALCDEFDLKDMRKGLIAQDLYIPSNLSEDLSDDVIHVSAKYPIGNEPREIFFFQQGTVVFWNVPYLERVNVLKFLKDFQDESFDREVVEEECEYMTYTHAEQGLTRLVRGKVLLGNESTNKLLEKYAFANALASSVKLGIWESTLEGYVEGIEHITEALKRAEKIKLSRAEVLQKTGELFALRHELNLNSDLLDTPDFYWERERLETLYQKTCDYLNINRRTKVMNEKLSQCCELLDLISSHLTDEHHTRLEWMIIILIMIEVGFEILHLLERYEVIQS